MPSFDGENLVITLDPTVAGVLDVDVIDNLYEPWKDWVRAKPQRRGYPQAFRPDGGNPLSSIIDQGRYTFLNNVDGWRIKPHESDGTYYLTGNLAVEDTALPAFLPTDGAFTAAILGLQPVTQGVTPVMGEQLEYASFVNGVWIDQGFGYPGTGSINGNPIGNAQNPSNNFPDGRSISLARGLPKTFYVIGDAVLDTGDNVEGYVLLGQNATRSNITINAGALTEGAEIREAVVTGNLDGGTILRQCVIESLNYVNGFVYECMLNPGTITLGGTTTAHFLKCYSGVPGTSTPIIDMNGTGLENTPLAMRGYNGGIKLIHKTGDAPCSIDLASGQVIVDLDTCIAGKIVVRGDGKVIDSLGNHLLSGMYGALEIVNECNYGDHIHDVWQRLGLDPDNPLTNKNDGSFSVGSINVTATPSGTDIVQTRS